VKRVFVESLKEGAKVEEVFLVTSKSVGNARNGAYIRLRLGDRTGQIDAMKWNASEAEIARFDEGDYVLVRGTVGTYNDNLQLTADSVKRFGDPVDPADFIRSSPRDPEQMMTEFEGLISQVTQPHLSRLLSDVFNDPQTRGKFMQAPAAKSVHHAYIGGLLEHTLNVVRSCSVLADLYPIVDRDLLLAGAALHDIGKLDEFTWSGAINYSDSGHLVGHIVGGAMLAARTAESIPGFDPLLSLALQHMILSHHGTKEWGSPKQPKSLEAVMLHAADDLDAKTAILAQAIEESSDSGAFTKRHYLLDRPIFKGLPRQADAAGEPASGEAPDLELFAVEGKYDPFADD